MEWVVDNLSEGGGRRDVVCNTSDGDGLSSLTVLPLAENAHQDIGGSAVVQQLTDEVEVRNQSCLKDDGHVGSVKQFDGVCTLLSTVLLVLHGEDNPPSLKVDDNHKDEDRGGEVGQVRQILSVDGLLDGADLVIARDEQVEKGDDGTFELRTASSVDGGRTEGLPHNVLANVGGDEETDSASKSVSLLEELIEGQHNESRAEELGDDEEGVTGSNGGEVSVHSTDDVSDGLAHSDQNSEQLLSSREQRSVLLHVVVHFNDTTSRQQLHDQPGGDNGRDTKFHEGTTVGSEDDTHPVEGIGGLGRLDTIDGDLTADKEDEECNCCPEDLFTEWDLTIRTCHLGQDAHHRSD
mmetsp:Transcript_29905/g.54997  ORF Transcript_29905/g.54997 Transcript_29905/m.54997 type:complete len:351 (+) Transcript_29905:815-1867(+)